MDKKKFESRLILIVPAVVKMIVENNQVDEIEATDLFYSFQALSRHGQWRLKYPAPTEQGAIQ